MDDAAIKGDVGASELRRADESVPRGVLVHGVRLPLLHDGALLHPELLERVGARSRVHNTLQGFERVNLTKSLPATVRITHRRRCRS